MMRRWYVFGGALALTAAALLLMPQASYAQRRGGGSGWGVGFGSGGVYVGPSYGGYGWGGAPGYGRNSYPGNYGFGNRAWDGGYSTYGWRGNYYDARPGYYTSTPGYYNSAPGYYNNGPVYSTPQYGSGWAGDSSSYGSMESSGNANSARLLVHVPPDAEVFVEGQRTNQSGDMREFESPPLESGRDYTYHLRAHWTENGRDVNRSREVSVHAGARVRIDFLGSDRDMDRDHRDRDVDRDRTNERRDRIDERTDRDRLDRDRIDRGAAPADRGTIDRRDNRDRALNRNDFNRNNPPERGTAPGATPGATKRGNPPAGTDNTQSRPSGGTTGDTGSTRPPR